MYWYFRSADHEIRFSATKRTMKFFDQFGGAYVLTPRDAIRYYGLFSGMLGFIIGAFVITMLNHLR